MLNERGGIETDLTVVRLDEEIFYLVTGTGFMTHDYDWIKSNISDDLDVQLENITFEHSVFSLMGPKSREILQASSNHDFDNKKFPFATFQNILIDNCPVKALRITYMGELGWELHFSIEHAEKVYDTLLKNGEPLGLKNAGYRTIESCRLEKGYRAWSSDIGPDHTPLEAGLGWAVKLKKDINFIGKKSLLDQQVNGIKKIFTTFVINDPEIILLGRETIYRNGKRVGWLSSGGFGYTINKSIGYGYVRSDNFIDKDYVLEGEYELEVATKKIKCSAHLDPLYDPKMLKIKT